VLLIIFHKHTSSFACQERNLTPREIRIDDYWQCTIHADSNMLEISSSASEITLTDSALQSGLLASISLHTKTFRIVKPLLYGLPIYYCRIDGAVVICSHIRYLREIGASLNLATSALPEYFVFRYVCPPGTLIQDVSCIPIDCTLSGSLQTDGQIALDLQWSKSFQSPAEHIDISHGIKLTEEALANNIKSLRSSAESVACLLSGGVDSSILYKMSADFLGTEVSHSTGYPFESKTENGEFIYAMAAAESLGATHTYHEFTTKAFLHAIVDSINHAEMPLIHLQTVLLDLLFRDRLSPSDTIILNGQGADGLYGLNIMFNYQHYKYLIQRPFAPLLKMASLVFDESFLPFDKFSHWARRQWNTNFRSPSNALWMLGIFGDLDWTKSFFQASDDDIFGGRRSAVEALRVESILDAFSALDFISDVAMTQDLWGQISAGYGRRQYYAFNTRSVVSAAQQVGWDQKLVAPKTLLREVGKNIGIPRSILDRPKLGFGIRSARWSTPGGLMEPILSVVGADIDADMVRSFQSTDESSAMMYWNWINLGVWQRLVLKGEQPEQIHAELEYAISAHESYG
jgi:asparagine synthetase B (glutamine-hydrolysing)